MRILYDSILSHTLFLNLHDGCSKVYIICGLTSLRPLLYNWVISYISKKDRFRKFSRAPLLLLCKIDAIHPTSILLLKHLPFMASEVAL